MINDATLRRLARDGRDIGNLQRLEYSSGSGSGSPGGADTNVQFNDAGAFGGSANLTWVANSLTVTGTLGVGAAVSKAVLDVIKGTSGALTFFSGPNCAVKITNAPYAVTVAGRNAADDAYYNMYLTCNATANLTLTTAGDVGIGLNPSYLLHAGGIIMAKPAGAGIGFDPNGATGDFYLVHSPANLTVSNKRVIWGDYNLTWPAADAHGYLHSDGAGVLSWDGAAHDLLSATHPDTTASSVTRGDLIVGVNGPSWDDLAVGGANAVLRTDGTDVLWSTFLLSGTAGGTTNFAVSNTKTLTLTANGDYNVTISGTGDMTLGTGTVYRLAVWTTNNSITGLGALGTTNAVLRSAGAAANPAWSEFLLTGTSGGTTNLAITNKKTLTLTSVDDFNLTVPATGTAVVGTGTATRVAAWSDTNTIAAGTIVQPAANVLTVTNSAAATLALAITAGKTLTLTTTDNFNLTIPATGTAALLGTANTFTVAQTIDGTADAVQLTVEGHSTQTNHLIDFKNSAHTVLGYFFVSAASSYMATLAPVASKDSGIAVWDGPDINNSGYAALSCSGATSASFAHPNMVALESWSNGTGITHPLGFFVGGVQVLTLTTVYNAKIAGTAVRATTEGTNHLDIFNGTAPVGTLTNGISIYSAAGECWIMDAGGTATQQTPHNERGEWIFYSKNTLTGKVLKIDMERMMKALNTQFGWNFVKEYVE